MSPPFVVDLTPRMSFTLERIGDRYGRRAVRVVSHYDGLPVLRFPNGRHAMLTTNGRLEWLGPIDRPQDGRPA
jgi:hypothetical protein